jgi:hypothetical protein
MNKKIAPKVEPSNQSQWELNPPLRVFSVVCDMVAQLMDFSVNRHPSAKDLIVGNDQWIVQAVPAQHRHKSVLILTREINIILLDKLRDQIHRKVVYVDNEEKTCQVPTEVVNQDSQKYKDATPHQKEVYDRQRLATERVIGPKKFKIEQVKAELARMNLMLDSTNTGTLTWEFTVEEWLTKLGSDPAFTFITLPILSFSGSIVEGEPVKEESEV